MIKQIIYVEDKWKIIVYYNVDYNLYHYIDRELQLQGMSDQERKSVFDDMKSGKAYAFTFTNTDERLSIVCFNRHKSTQEYMSSIVHEAEHVKEDMLKYYNVNNMGEPPAYTIGYIV